ncbi:hypothetical protein [Nonomuraea dietziae]|uniref:hypothetical protein n=1 Tax=Nonomuraea dietziae TaxID=65515 RepID=UPI0033E6E832
MDFALGYWVWSFLAAPEPVPERLITAAPSVFVDHMLDSWSQKPDVFPPEARAAYTAQFTDPATVHAICEEYSAAATLDREHDETDRGRRRIACPTLALWSAAGPVAEWYEPLEIWQAWADDVRGAPSSPGTSSPRRRPTRRPGISSTSSPAPGPALAPSRNRPGALTGDRRAWNKVSRTLSVGAVPARPRCPLRSRRRS